MAGCAGESLGKAPEGPWCCCYAGRAWEAAGRSLVLLLRWKASGYAGRAWEAAGRSLVLLLCWESLGGCWQVPGVAAMLGGFWLCWESLGSCWQVPGVAATLGEPERLLAGPWCCCYAGRAVFLQFCWPVMVVSWRYNVYLLENNVDYVFTTALGTASVWRNSLVAP